MKHSISDPKTGKISFLLGAYLILSYDDCFTISSQVTLHQSGELTVAERYCNGAWIFLVVSQLLDDDPQLH